MEKRLYNFSAGPAILPLPALEEAQRDLVTLQGAGMSVMELSHRSKEFEQIIKTAEQNVRRLLGLSDAYKVLFLHGGARMQFSMIPMNFLRGAQKPADYIVTGSWGEIAAGDAKLEGQANVAWTGKADGYNRTPAAEEVKLSADPAYVHFTSNETIQGVEFFDEPNVGGAPLICDASSDIFSRPIPVDRYAMIYAGAQKNAGPAGVGIVILREDMLERVAAGLHSMLDYKVHVKNESLYNTPPCFAIYMIMLTTKWLLEDIGGLEKMETINRRKAALLYEAIDQSGGYYRGHAEKACRSLMNVSFRLPSEELEKKFLGEAKENGMVQLKGHRSVGGIRASIYNAMPEEGVQALRDFMSEFQQKNG